MFGYRVSLWRNAWKRNHGIRMFVITVAAMGATVALLTAAAWIATPKTAVEPAAQLPKTEYCYTSEDGDWLICRLEE